MEKGIKKGQKKLIQDFNALGWLQIFLAILSLLVGIFAKNSSVQTTGFLLMILHFVISFLMFRGKKFAVSGSERAYTYGIVTGILLILSLDLIDIILGILVLLDTSEYKKILPE